MTAKYRVIVEQIGDDKDETLFEVVGDARRVARVIANELGDLFDVGHAANLADRVLDSALAAGAAATAPAAEPVDEVKAKRNRRTKQQIAADKEAEGLGYRDAAHRAEVESQQQVTDATVGVGDGSAQPDAPAAATPPPATGPQVGAPIQAPAGSAPGEVWNPFTGVGTPPQAVVQPTH